jgi:hypothetical protein
MRKLNVKQKRILDDLVDNNTKIEATHVMYDNWSFFNKLEAIHDYDGMIHDADRYVNDRYWRVGE